MPAEVGMMHRLPHFKHLFSGGYAAGYYSYMWSEVLDADGFDAFKEAGDVFDPELSKRLKDIYGRETHAIRWSFTSASGAGSRRPRRCSGTGACWRRNNRRG
jgi:hypothetical protein